MVGRGLGIDSTSEESVESLGSLGVARLRVVLLGETVVWVLRDALRQVVVVGCGLGIDSTSEEISESLGSWRFGVAHWG